MASPLTYACAYGAIMAVLLRVFFLGPLGDESVAMHKKQLDPTEIVAIPYDLRRLAIFVSVSILCAALLTDSTLQRRNLVHLLPLTIGCTGLFILSGASPYENLYHTVLAAAYFVNLCWFDPPILAALHPTQQSTFLSSLVDSFQQRLQGMGWRPRRGLTLADEQSLIWMQTKFYCCVACTVPFQILLLYDRGWQVQRWPVPVVLGSTIGWILGLCLGTIAATSHVRSEQLAKKTEESSTNSN